MTVKDFNDYEVIAAGNGEKLERWGDVYFLRPDPQVIWNAPFPLGNYPKLNARYTRESTGGGRWDTVRPFKQEWTISYKDLKFLIKPMGFKHTGLFPEQAANWQILRKISDKQKGLRVLNLFGYTGGATVAMAKSGANVTHVDAAKNMVERCKKNAELSRVAPDKIRYIVDDCKKFVEREIRRGKTYDGIIMDPPSYGRGPNGEMWKLEESLSDLIELTVKLLEKPKFYLINSYTTGLQPTVIKNLLNVNLKNFEGTAQAYELCLPVTEGNVELPAGCSGMWLSPDNYGVM